MNFSFIIPSYNQAKFLPVCLDSIASQNLDEASFELIVIDGGSTDGSAKIIAAHPAVSEWVSEPDRGHWDAVNKGILKSSGEYIAWINSDDFYFADVFRRLNDYIDAHPGFDVYYCDADEVDQNGHLLRPYKVEDWNYESLIDRCIISQPATIIRRSVFSRFGLLSSECQVALDLEYWLRIGQNAKFHRVPLKVACSRIWGGTKSSAQQLAIQKEALYFGHKYGGRWSGRRISSVAEARMLKRFPRMEPKYQKSGSVRFYLLRLAYIFDVFLKCILGRFILVTADKVKI